MAVGYFYKHWHPSQAIVSYVHAKRIHAESYAHFIY